MFFKLSGPLLILAALLGGLGEACKLEFPTVRFPFTLGREISWLSPWFGWLFMVLMLGAGIWCCRRFWPGDHFTPITRRRIERFKSIKRGYISLVIVSVLAIVAGLDHVIVGKEALAVRYQGEWSFPAFTRNVEKGVDYGVEGDKAEAPADFRQLKKDFLKADGNDRVIMPLIGFAPTGDTVDAVSTGLEEQKGVVRKGNELFSGLGSKIYDLDNPARMHLRFRFRKGVKDGPADGWDREGNRVYGAIYQAGKMLEQTWNGQGEVEDFLGQQSSGLRVIHFAPSPPTAQPGQRHLLGTNSSGYDVVAYLFGGLQVNFKAALVYIPLVYLLGVSIGLLMGFFGGWFDLILQRIIEILSNVPFLFVVMITSQSVPEKLKETAGLWMILFILLCFGWMGMTYLMRTSALKEKQRDYIAASRVIGASTPRILFRHLLPNSIAIIITLVPFSVSSLVLALTSLDYLGFGLPSAYATWGQLLRDGLDNIAAPWLVTSAFLALVVLLILITFIGEAVREAFDPKKFSYYR
ncbi:MAG: ABC transporter permease subunit [Verrucomicrobiaceae bacterium]|nr:ABC transporter permease subunit [Verrucomicrobiaceae bacterium]